MLREIAHHIEVAQSLELAIEVAFPRGAAVRLRRRLPERREDYGPQPRVGLEVPARIFAHPLDRYIVRSSSLSGLARQRDGVTF